ncbi:MAG: glycine-rich domain-containing protein, partial [Candidatus Pacearchaeota archaeon]
TEGYSVTPGQTINLTIGHGGKGSASSLDDGTSGQNSIFGTITATGGGRGAGGQAGLSAALVGGSGGGGDGERPTAGASGTALQGNSGGSGLVASGGGGGGGGAGAVGSNSSTTYGASGGAGLANSITGASIYYAGGGGGGNNNTIVGDAAGGIGGGGAGGLGIGESGVSGLGGGGGGGTWNLLTGTGGNGGSGTVIVRYVIGGGLGMSSSNPGTDCNQIYIFNSLARTSGVYWVKPDTSPAFRVYCDMVTDGGGWTLIGKGREGWNWNNAGQGTADDVALNPDTNTVSFLPSTKVDALVGGVDISSMTGAVRIYRHGVDQDWRFNYPTMTTWDWGMSTSKTAVVASRTPACTGTTSGNTNDTYWCDAVNGCNRIFTWAWANHNSVMGWSAGSYCNCTAYGEDGWCYTTEGHVILRTQVWIKNLNPKPALPIWKEISPF